MKVIITGAAGFIGRNLWSVLVDDKVPTVGLDLTLGHDLSKCRIFDVCRSEADVVFHLAGCSDAYQDPSSCINTNILTTLNVLKHCQMIKAKLVFASTYLETGPYALSKRCCEQLINAFDVDYAIVRCCNVYGPGDRNTNRVIPSLISKMLKNQQVQLTNTHRDFVYIDDLVDAYVAISKGPQEKGLLIWNYQIGGTGLIPLSSVASEIKELTGSTSEIVYTDIAQDAPRVDLHAINQLGWKPKTEMREGLKRTIEWWRNELSGT
jgi:nucleoside-diphosphate-sugar epimerase